MKFLANENFPVSSTKLLKDKGYDIIHIGVDYSGISDMEVIDLAIKQKRTIITFDRDYGELVFKYGHKPPSGIIYLRFKEFDEYEPGLLLLKLFEDESLKYDSLFTVLDRNHIRQKKYIH